MNKLLLGIITLGCFSSFVFASDSANSRDSLKFQVAVPLIGQAHSIMYTSGIEVAYFLNKKENLGVRYLGYNNPRGYEGEYTGKVIEIFYKNFTGNSFYTRSALFSRDMNITEKEDSDYKFNDFGAGFSLGNQWQWKNFTMGCDWIGLNARLGVFHYEDSKNSKAVFKTRGYTFTANILNLYFGYSF